MLDPDGVTAGSVAWQWKRSPDGTTAGNVDTTDFPNIAGATGENIMLTEADDAGRWLRAMAIYSDSFGPGQRARAQTASQVLDPPQDRLDGQPQMTVTAPTAQTVPHDWSLIPSGVEPGDSFRLLFLTSTTRGGDSTDIADYNTHVQTAANNNVNLRPFKSEFRAIISTSDVDARDNTATAPAGSTYTTGEGVPIYWLGGAKAADNYADFYDNSWASRAARVESGNEYLHNQGVYTGSNDDGTKHSTGFAGNSGAVPSVMQGKTRSGSPSADNLYFPPHHTSQIYALSPVITVLPPPPTGAADGAG